VEKRGHRERRESRFRLAVRQWRFDPGRVAGVPVDVIANVIVDFSIR